MELVGKENSRPRRHELDRKININILLVVCVWVFWISSSDELHAEEDHEEDHAYAVRFLECVFCALRTGEQCDAHDLSGERAVVSERGSTLSSWMTFFRM